MDTKKIPPMSDGATCWRSLLSSGVLATVLLTACTPPGNSAIKLVSYSGGTLASTTTTPIAYSPAQAFSGRDPFQPPFSTSVPPTTSSPTAIGTPSATGTGTSSASTSTTTVPPTGGANSGFGGTAPRQFPVAALLVVLAVMMLGSTLFAIRQLPKN
jgi:hypothetical protein